MSNIATRYADREFKIGDAVLARHGHGNLGEEGYSHLDKTHIGLIEKVFHLRTGSGDGNTTPVFPYEVSGHIAGWAEDELTLITPEIVKRGLE